MQHTTTLDYLGLQRTAVGWSMPLSAHAIGGRGDSLFGGAGLAAAVAVLEAETAQPPVWVTAQFVSPSAPGADLAVDVAVTKAGRSVTQAEVTISDADGLVVRALGACGSRRNEHHAEPLRRPTAIDPESSTQVPRRRPDPSLHDHVDTRMARGMFGFSGTGDPSGDNRTLVWLRMPHVMHDAAALAIMGDFMPSAAGNVLGEVVGATSLDNTIRFHGPIDPVDDWLLLEARIDLIGDGFGTGTGHLWQRDGRLVASVSQSFIVSAMTPFPA